MKGNSASSVGSPDAALPRRCEQVAPAAFGHALHVCGSRAYHCSHLRPARCPCPAARTLPQALPQLRPCRVSSGSSVHGQWRGRSVDSAANVASAALKTRRGGRTAAAAADAGGEARARPPACARDPRLGVCIDGRGEIGAPRWPPAWQTPAAATLSAISTASLSAVTWPLLEPWEVCSCHRMSCETMGGHTQRSMPAMGSVAERSSATVRSLAAASTSCVTRMPATQGHHRSTVLAHSCMRDLQHVCLQMKHSDVVAGVAVSTEDP
jgi:hypothetical protein